MGFIILLHTEVLIHMGARWIFPGVGKLKGLGDGSFPAGFRGRTLVEVCDEPLEAVDDDVLKIVYKYFVY